jgi:hypothetical protein
MVDPLSPGRYVVSAVPSSVEKTGLSIVMVAVMLKGKIEDASFRWPPGVDLQGATFEPVFKPSDEGSKEEIDEDAAFESDYFKYYQRTKAATTTPVPESSESVLTIRMAAYALFGVAIVGCTAGLVRSVRQQQRDRQAWLASQVEALGGEQAANLQQAGNPQPTEVPKEAPKPDEHGPRGNAAGLLGMFGLEPEPEETPIQTGRDAGEAKTLPAPPALPPALPPEHAMQQFVGLPVVQVTEEAGRGVEASEKSAAQASPGRLEEALERSRLEAPTDLPGSLDLDDLDSLSNGGLTPPGLDDAMPPPDGGGGFGFSMGPPPAASGGGFGFSLRSSFDEVPAEPRSPEPNPTPAPVVLGLKKSPAKGKAPQQGGSPAGENARKSPGTGKLPAKTGPTIDTDLREPAPSPPKAKTAAVEGKPVTTAQVAEGARRSSKFDDWDDSSSSLTSDSEADESRRKPSKPGATPLGFTSP